MKKFYSSNSLCGRLESGGESLAPWSFSLSLSSRQALLGPGFPCMARSGVMLFLALYPVLSQPLVSLGKGRAGHYPLRWPLAQCQLRPWGTPV